MGGGTWSESLQGGGTRSPADSWGGAITSEVGSLCFLTPPFPIPGVPVSGLSPSLFRKMLILAPDPGLLRAEQTASSWETHPGLPVQPLREWSLSRRQPAQCLSALPLPRRSLSLFGWTMNLPPWARSSGPQASFCINWEAGTWVGKVEKACPRSAAATSNWLQSVVSGLPCTSGKP